RGWESADVMRDWSTLSLRDCSTNSLPAQVIRPPRKVLPPRRTLRPRHLHHSRRLASSPSPAAPRARPAPGGRAAPRRVPDLWSKKCAGFVFPRLFHHSVGAHASGPVPLPPLPASLGDFDALRATARLGDHALASAAGCCDLGRTSPASIHC